MNRTTRILSTITLSAAAFAALQGPAAAQTREHVLLARQTPAPATSTFDLAAPADEPVLAAWFVRYEGVDGDLSDGAGSSGDDCWDWTDADTGEAMTSCP
jgi:hypothetical protein